MVAHPHQNERAIMCIALKCPPPAAAEKSLNARARSRATPVPARSISPMLYSPCHPRPLTPAPAAGAAARGRAGAKRACTSPWAAACS